VRAVGQLPWQALTIIAVWAVVARWRRLYAVPAAVLVTVILVALAAPAGLAAGRLWPEPVLVVPSLTPAALVGITLPLFIVTMASQNIPGMTVLAVNGYRPDFGLMLRATGLFSLAAAPFGGHAVNLAAITAALCAGEDADPDPKRRYWAGVVAGAAYVGFGLLAGAATSFIASSPPVLIEAVAGLALLGALSNALAAALAEAADREAAIVTFLVTASGVTLFGIGGAFWGLVAGGAIMTLARWR
jgi:benzoate membrane transport protein